jgi:hypothetical protein
MLQVNRWTYVGNSFLDYLDKLIVDFKSEMTFNVLYRKPFENFHQFNPTSDGKTLVNEITTI